MYTRCMETPPTYTTPVDWVGTEHLGYVINAAFSGENAKVITNWLDGLQQVAPEGVYPMDSKGLHITVLDWIAPLFDYGGANKKDMYRDLGPRYDAAFRYITGNMKPFDVHFTELRVTPGAIILVGQDTGEFQSLRNEFVDSVGLPEGAKEPPKIIHSTLARFIAPAIEIGPLEDYAANHSLSLTQRVEAFRLVETRREPMQDFTVLDTYKLG